MNRELSKEIAAFVEMVDTHLARIAEALAPFLRRVSQRYREATTREIMLRAWHSRDSFVPTALTPPMWFRQIAKLELDDGVIYGRVYSEIEDAVLAALGHNAKPVAAPASYPIGVKTEVQVEAPQESGKECPPCWRCRYFDGWLPLRDVVPRAYEDPEITASCDAIDKRKVEIAYQVRGTYPAALLED